MNASTQKNIHILHITAEYPNLYRTKNTLAVRHFINELTEMNNIVVAITRTANPFKQAFNINTENNNLPIISLHYWALPFGIFSRLALFIASRRILSILSKYDLRFDCIHAHKLTTEGIISYYLSKSTGLPYLVSVRGESDSKFYKYKPYIIPYLNKILDKSHHIFYVSAWFKQIVSKYSDIPEEKQSNLPNFVRNIPETSNEKNNVLVSVLDLNVYKKKGLNNLIESFHSIAMKYPDVILEIYGSGSTNSISEIEKLIRQYNLEDKVFLQGAIENQELIKKVSTSIGLALPSFNETFGMVYVEALLAGVPILFSTGTGIDGFIDSVKAKVGVDPNNIQAISEGLLTLIENSDIYRQWLKEHQDEVHSLFDKNIYITEYKNIISDMAKPQY